MEIKLNTEQAYQFAYDWYDIIVSSIAKEESRKEEIHECNLKNEYKGGMRECNL